MNDRTISKGYRITASTGIHKGDREYQQDRVKLFSHARAPGCMLGVVADGMGGRSGGRKASDQVILTAQQLFEQYAPSVDDAPAMLKQLINEAHVVIKLTALSSEQEPHSTLAAFVINPGGDCHWAHTGDSRIYHFRNTKLEHRTIDHSYVQTLVDKGVITEEQANFHPQSNVLIGSLGMKKMPPITHHVIPCLQPGDCLLACSDGIWHYIGASEMSSAVNTLSARQASEFLILTARSRAKGNGDNLSVVIVKFGSLA